MLILLALRASGETLLMETAAAYLALCFTIAIVLGRHWFKPHDPR